MIEAGGGITPEMRFRKRSRRYLPALTAAAGLLIGSLHAGATGAEQNTGNEQEVTLDVAKKDSIVDSVRLDVHEALGITGQGVTIGVITPLGEQGLLLQEQTSESASQAEAIGDAATSIAPGATVKYYGDSTAELDKPLPPLLDNVKEFNRYLHDYASSYPTYAAKAIQNALSNLEMQDTKPSILVIPDDLSPVKLAKAAMGVLDQKDAEGHYKNPIDREHVYGSSGEVSLPESEQKALAYVKWIFAGGQFGSAMEKYSDAILLASNQGAPPVVSIGSSHNVFTSPTDAYAERNYLTAPYIWGRIVAVGSSDTQQTPNDETDDTATSYSSLGGSDFVTIASSSILNSKSKSGEEYVNSGPYATLGIAAGELALMADALQKGDARPLGLSIDLIKSDFKKTAIQAEGCPPVQCGAGVWEPVEAVKHILRNNYQSTS